MDLKLDLHATEEFRREVKQLIQGQVRGILREELGGIVAGEIAKLRLLQPDSPTLSTMVEGYVTAAVKRHVAYSESQMRDETRLAIQKVVKDMLSPSLDNIRMQLRDEMIRALQKL